MLPPNKHEIAPEAKLTKAFNSISHALFQSIRVLIVKINHVMLVRLVPIFFVLIKAHAGAQQR